jgi:hypothetical protein
VLTSDGAVETYSTRRRETGARRPERGRHGRRRATYSREEILEALRRWTDTYGEPPAMTDWDPGRARRLKVEWRAERFENGSWPSVGMVRRQFESFTEAVELAGLRARPAPKRLRAHLADPGAVLEAMREWTRRYGDVPTMADWDPARARRLRQDWRIARYHQGDWPSVRTVLHHFGSFGAAIDAAGFVPRARSATSAERRLTWTENQRRAAEAASRAHAPGIEGLAAGLTALASARSSGDPVGVQAALMDVAAAALAWAEIGGVEIAASRD